MNKNIWLIFVVLQALFFGCDKVHINADAQKRFRYHENIKSLALDFSKESWSTNQSARKKRVVDLLVLNLKPNIRENLEIRIYRSDDFELGKEGVPLIILTKNWHNFTDQTGIDYEGDLIPAAEIELEPYEIINPFEVH